MPREIGWLNLLISKGLSENRNFQKKRIVTFFVSEINHLTWRAPGVLIQTK